MSRYQAACFIARYSAVMPCDLLRDRERVDTAYRAACKRLHPDAGGSEAAFNRLQRAYLVLVDDRARSPA